MSVSHTLQIDEFAEQPMQIPVHIDYHEYSADQTSSAGCSFRIDSPGSGALLDSEAWIQYQVKFSNTNTMRDMFNYTNVNPSNASAQRGVKMALRQGFTMQRAMQSISLNINGTTLVERPDRYADQVLRFYTMPQEAETIMSASGGYLDNGFGYALTESDNQFRKGIAGGNTHATSIVPGVGYSGTAVDTYFGQGVPDSDFFINKGYSKRNQKLMRAYRDAGDPSVDTNAGGVVAYPLEFTLLVQERLPISPFMNYEARDLKRSIPHVNQMTLNINWNSKTHSSAPGAGALGSMIVQGADQTEGANVGAIFQSLTVDWFTAAPVLRLKWIIPPMGYRLPPQISIPIIDYQHFSQKALDVAMLATQKSVTPNPITYNNIRLEQFPDYLFLYLCPEQSDMLVNQPSEFQCEIVQLDISADGDSGKLLGATSIELYAMYVRNALGREMIRTDYEQWRQHHCLVVLTPDDLGLRFSPGIRNPITLNIRATIRIHWNRSKMSVVAGGNLSNFCRVHQGENLWGAANRTVNWNVLCEYRKYRLTLTEAGGSRRELLSLPRSDVQSLPQAVPSASSGGLQGVF